MNRKCVGRKEEESSDGLLKWPHHSWDLWKSYPTKLTWYNGKTVKRIKVAVLFKEQSPRMLTLTTAYEEFA